MAALNLWGDLHRNDRGYFIGFHRVQCRQAHAGVAGSIPWQFKNVNTFLQHVAACASGRRSFLAGTCGLPFNCAAYRYICTKQAFFMKQELHEQLAYPIGRFVPPASFDNDMLDRWIGKIEAAPSWYDYSIENLDEAQLQTPYRPGGWTIIQVIHHVADSHMNGYIRFRMVLTESDPVIKPYAEQLWAGLPDIGEVPVNVSVTLLHALHRRWVATMRGMHAEAWTMAYIHPEHNRKIPLWEAAAHYAWHGRHHFEHIFSLRERMGWL